VSVHWYVAPIDVVNASHIYVIQDLTE